MPDEQISFFDHSEGMPIYVTIFVTLVTNFAEQMFRAGSVFFFKRVV